MKILVVRAPFLPLALILAFLGTAVAWYDGAFKLGIALLVAFGLLLAHISVNVFKYFDFKSVVDLSILARVFAAA